MSVQVYPRSTWGPRYSNGQPNVVIGTGAWVAGGKQVWLHHSVTNPPGPGATLEQDCAHMREFESIGQSSFGQGISYTWVIMPSGRVFQGHDIDRRGAHTYGRNDTSRAICFAGNFEVSQPTAAQLASCSQLLGQLGTKLSGGHRDVYPTACPGRNAYDKIARINASIGEEDDMPYSPQQIQDIVAKALTTTVGNDKRNVLDSVIQTRSELRDRAREAAQEVVAPVAKDVAAVKAGQDVVAARVDALSRLVERTGVGGTGAPLDYAALARAVADEMDRRARDGDPKTGPAS